MAAAPKKTTRRPAKKKATTKRATTTDNVSDELRKVLKDLDGIDKDMSLYNADIKRGSVAEMSVHSGSYTLDLLFGGGNPAGRMIMLYGPEGGGKSTVALAGAAAGRRKGATVYIYDAEGGTDALYAGKLGLDVSGADPLVRLKLPDTGEEVFEHMVRVMDTLEQHNITYETMGHPPAIFIIDSLAAMAPSEQVVDGQKRLGTHARLFSSEMRAIKTILRRTGCVLIAVNQVRFKIGSYGNPEDTPGGWAPKFYSDLTVRLGAVKGKTAAVDEVVVDGQMQYHRYINVVTRKNKVHRPFQKGSLRLILGEGLDKVYDAVCFLQAVGVIFIASPGYYHFNGVVKADGELKKLRMSEVEAEVRANLRVYRRQCRRMIRTGDAFKRIVSIEAEATDGDDEDSVEA